MKVCKAIALFLLPIIYYPILSAQPAVTGEADVVVLVDTSGTVLQYYEDINKRVLTEITKKFVRKGDRVHILSFNADARYEMSQKINGEADLSRVVSRFLLLYQLGRNSDFLTGLKYCMQYTSNLASKKERILVVISDGIFNPPETSPYKNYGADRIKNEMSLLAASIRQNGWKVYYVKLPFPADAVIKDLDGAIYAQDKKNSTADSATPVVKPDGKTDLKNGADFSASARPTESTNPSARPQGGTQNAHSANESVQNAETPRSRSGAPSHNTEQKPAKQHTKLPESTNPSARPQDGAQNAPSANEPVQNAEAPRGRSGGSSHNTEQKPAKQHLKEENGRDTENSAVQNHTLKTERILPKKEDEKIGRTQPRDMSDTDTGADRIGKTGNTDSPETILSKTGKRSSAAETAAATKNGADDGGIRNNAESSENPKTEYIDISKTFTEDTGITASDLPEDKNESLEIKDDEAKLPSITFPEELEAVGRKLTFPIEISNGTDKTASLKLTGIVLDNGMRLDRLPVNGSETEIRPGKKAVIKVQARLPKEYTTGRYKVILRLEFENDKRVLPQTAGFPLAVYPSVWERLTEKLTVRHITAGIILLLLLLMLLLFFLLRRRNRPNSSLKLKAGTVKPSAVSRSTPVPEYAAWNTAAISAGSVPESGIQPQKPQADTAAFVMQNRKPLAAFYPQEEKRNPERLSEEENHSEKLHNFGTKNAGRPTETPAAAYTERQKKEYPMDNLSAFAAQTRADQALRIKMLTSSLFLHTPRSGTMLPANRFEKIEIRADRLGMTEMYVLNQNRNIGKRNIHKMKPGTSLSVGGSSRDDFLIFLVPFPARIAEVRYDGREYHLAVLKPEFFPYEAANIVNNCIGKTITAVSSKGYHVYFTFREYEDPTEKLNGLLTSIQYTD